MLSYGLYPSRKSKLAFRWWCCPFSVRLLAILPLVFCLNSFACSQSVSNDRESNRDELGLASTSGLPSTPEALIRLLRGIGLTNTDTSRYGFTLSEVVEAIKYGGNDYLAQFLEAARWTVGRTIEARHFRTQEPPPYALTQLKELSSRSAGRNVVQIPTFNSFDLDVMTPITKGSSDMMPRHEPLDTSQRLTTIYAQALRPFWNAGLIDRILIADNSSTIITAEIADVLKRDFGIEREVIGQKLTRVLVQWLRDDLGPHPDTKRMIEIFDTAEVIAQRLPPEEAALYSQRRSKEANLYVLDLEAGADETSPYSRWFDFDSNNSTFSWQYIFHLLTYSLEHPEAVMIKGASLRPDKSIQIEFPETKFEELPLDPFQGRATKWFRRFSLFMMPALSLFKGPLNGENVRLAGLAMGRERRGDVFGYGGETDELRYAVVMYGLQRVFEGEIPVYRVKPEATDASKGPEHIPKMTWRIIATLAESIPLDSREEKVDAILRMLKSWREKEFDQTFWPKLRPNFSASSTGVPWRSPADVLGKPELVIQATRNPRDPFLNDNDIAPLYL